MSKPQHNDRRTLLKAAAAIGLGGLSGLSSASSPIGAMVPGKGWVKLSGEQCEGDGTPLQFVPKTAADPNPLQNELAKHQACPYCGMKRSQWNHSRHLVHYDDGVADGTCSIHCLAISLSLNLDRGPRAIYAADFGSDAKIKPMVNVDQATYLIGSKLKGTMARQSRMAFSSADAAKKAQAAHGGKLADFDEALKQAYLNMASDTVMIRQRRAEKRRKMMQKMKKMGS
jgi:nitrous oxide reductase accessory protein NosL